ncbi:integrase catalytic domain-containing protein [Trichonephila clavata]|uniref:Integrase catalytic domain-containing protein n=1 Tax=Trichonephila clavata TaxID=2740835 RepID=A0A8X6G097_TRICU|nr:integrase catalytic domain-containing protein [Trichonephila clavata]
MGKSLSYTTCSNHAMPVISLLNGSKICDLWSLDILGIRDPVENKTRKDIDDDTVSFFEKTVKFNQGRYEVNLPWVEGHPKLLDLQFQSEKRLNTMTSKLISTGKFDSYDKILKEWEQLGIIEPVPINIKGVNLSQQKCRYLPHRAVFKESSLTTKIRPVFDASAKDENSISLNQCLATGPNYIEMIPSILNKFRKNGLGVISDIRKAFLQISISPTDRDYLRFLWWENYEKREIKIYRHCRVVFGLSSSPFLLMATIYHHLEKERNDVAVKLKDSFYVDNVVASVQNEIELQRFQTIACQVMSRAGFELTGWVSSAEQQNQEKTKCSVLGLLWEPNTDLLTCDLRNISTEINDTCSKRQLLSISQKIFDPIGFTAPVTLIPKLLMQKAWKNYKLTWDQKLPSEIVEEFKNWLASLEFLKLVQIPRYFGGLVDESTTTLHMFSDASGKAFAACVFLRIECDNKVKIKLVQAKSRVAPLKKDPITKTKNEMSIPKLELLAAVIGTRLVQSVKTSLNIHSIQTFYWTDSKVVLCWIKNSGTWKTFVRNRIKEIHSSSSKEDWYYVPSQMDAADIASRGCNAQTLFSLCWWEGPIWLKNRSSWPDTKDSDFKDALELATEVRKPTVTTNLSLNDSDSNFFEWTKRVSKFSSIVRTLAYVKRFLSNAKSVANRQKDCLLKGNLSEKELSKSELEILLFIQKETFGKNRRLIPPNFVVYLDSDGLLRVETKLFSTDTGDYFRRPILLPDKQELVLRLIEETHRIHNHALVIVLRGIQALDLDLNDMQNPRKRAKHLHAVKHKLKTRFQKEYISLLKQTSNKVQTPLSVGDIVLISLDNKKRVDWPLAKIVEIYKGRDGVSRVARLKTQSGELIRPIQRLCRLETSGKIAEIMREPITTRRGRTIKS